MIGGARSLGTLAADETAMMAAFLRTIDARYSFPQNMETLKTAEDGIPW